MNVRPRRRHLIAGGEVLFEQLDRLELHQWVALAVCVVASFTDLRTRRIPNTLTLGGAILALTYAVLYKGVEGVVFAVMGWGAGLATFLPFYVLGGMGAGDVKLMACLGAWLGPVMAIWTGLYAALAGGVMGIAVALASGYFRALVRNMADLLTHFRVLGVRPHPVLTLERSKGPRLPYALPITAGAIVAMWLH